MTEADELRRLLDERGVEYTTDDGRFAKVTKWLALNGRLAIYAEYSSGEKRFAMDSLSLTPEQAIAATLGGGTCKQILTDCNDGLMPPFKAHCSVRGAEWGFTPKYCYECGAEVTGTRDERKAVER